jgi:hypothetical protein
MIASMVILVVYPNSAAVFDNNVTQWNASRSFQFTLRRMF